MNIGEEIIVLLTTYTGIIILAFFMQLLANFVIVFSIRKNTKEIKEMLEEIYIPYKEKNDYNRNVEEEEQNKKNAILKEIMQQEKEKKRKQSKEKAEQDWNEIKQMLHEELNPKITATAIIIMIAGIIGIGIFFIF